MRNFRVYYLSYNKHKILKALLLIFVIALASVPVIFLVSIFLPKGISSQFTLEYLDEDVDYDEIDYSGIENSVYLKHVKNTSWMVYLT